MSWVDIFPFLTGICAVLYSLQSGPRKYWGFDKWWARWYMLNKPSGFLHLALISEFFVKSDLVRMEIKFVHVFYF
jgi:hypothetical protein